MRKSAFNADYLYEGYPDDLLQNVLRGREIFGGNGMHRTDRGFEQHLEGAGFDIYYSVEPGEVYFRDRANAILIKIKTIQN